MAPSTLERNEAQVTIQNCTTPLLHQPPPITEPVEPTPYQKSHYWLIGNVNNLYDINKKVPPKNAYEIWYHMEKYSQGQKLFGDKFIFDTADLRKKKKKKNQQLSDQIFF